jgi:fucose 4-O-acetylase-like acetyltransferase
VQLWFLPSLFVTSLFALLFYRIVLIRIDNRYLRWMILLGLQALAVAFLDVFYPYSISLFGKNYELYGLPFSLDIVFLSGFFYILGNEVRQVSSEKAFGNLWLLVGTGGGLLLLTLLFKQSIDFNTRVFESFPVNTTEAILGILFALAVSKQIDLRTTRLAAALKYIGQASLFILIFHVPIQEFWAPKIHFVTNWRAFSILSGFVISVLVSLGFYRIFVEQNPIALFWYGRTKALPKKTKG